MQLFSAITAFAAFQLAAALPSSAETGVVTHVTTDKIPAAYKISNETDITARDLEERASLGVFLCVNAGFNQPCEHIVSQSNQCIGLDSTLYAKVSAVGPDQGAYCRFFFTDNCQEPNGCKHFDTVYPGYSDLSQLGNSCDGTRPNDNIRSYFCVPS